MNPDDARRLGSVMVTLGRSGFELAPHPTDPRRLLFRPLPMPSDCADTLRRLRAEVLAMMREPVHAPQTDARFVACERLGIADELGMPTHIGSPGWLIALGESLRN